MEFRTKKELLKYLGKNENDRKLVDRMIAKGEIHMEDRMYIYEDKDGEIERLKEEIKNLKENGANSSKVSESELESDLEYINKEYEKMEESRLSALLKCYKFMVQRKRIKEEDTPFESFFEWAIRD